MLITYKVNDENEQDITKQILHNFLVNCKIFLIIKESDIDNKIEIKITINNDTKIYNYENKVLVTEKNENHFNIHRVIDINIFNVYYGTDNNNIDVTELALKHFVKNDILDIPDNDFERSKVFGDFPGENKYITIYHIGQVYTVKNFRFPINVKNILNKRLLNNNQDIDINDLFNEYYNNIILIGGIKFDEIPEMLFTISFVNKNDVVLEIGSNIGRNTMVIAGIVKNENFVTVETSKSSFELLNINKLMNGFHFHTENSAISKRPLMQKHWITTDLVEPMPPDYFKVNTISYDDLKRKYNLKFTFLIVDGEGCMVNILKDDESILEDVQKIIIENDYKSIEDKRFVDSIFEKHGFKLIFNLDGPKDHICHSEFYQLFIKQ